MFSTAITIFLKIPGGSLQLDFLVLLGREYLSVSAD
jgi:hypothetical protein